MLDVGRDANPGMHVLFVDRANRQRKVRIGESTHRNANDIGMAFDYVMNRCAAGGTEMKRCLASGIANANEGC